MEPTRSAGAGGPGPAGLPGWPERLPARPAEMAGRRGRPGWPARAALRTGPTDDNLADPCATIARARIARAWTY